MSSFLFQPDLAQDVFVVLGQILANDPFLYVAWNAELFLDDLLEITEGGTLRYLEGYWTMMRRFVFHVEGYSGRRKIKFRKKEDRK